MRLSRENAAFASDQALSAIAKVAPHLDAEGQGAVLRSLVNADVLQTMARSSDLQLNAYVLEFVRGFTREHELGLTEVLQARVAGVELYGPMPSVMDAVPGSIAINCCCNRVSARCCIDCWISGQCASVNCLRLARRGGRWMWPRWIWFKPGARAISGREWRDQANHHPTVDTHRSREAMCRDCHQCRIGLALKNHG